MPERRARLSIDDLAVAVDTGTRVLYVSSVEFFTSFRNDLAALGELCRKRDVLFVIDGIQSGGALHIDVTRLGIDCLAADGHKWLLGSEGCGLFFCSPKAQERLQVQALGWASVESCFDFLDYSLELQPDARRFDIRHPEHGRHSQIVRSCRGASISGSGIRGIADNVPHLLAL